MIIKPVTTPINLPQGSVTSPPTTAEASQLDSTVVGGEVTFVSDSTTFNIQSSVAAACSKFWGQHHPDQFCR